MVTKDKFVGKWVSTIPWSSDDYLMEYAYP